MNFVGAKKWSIVTVVLIVVAVGLGAFILSRGSSDSGQVNVYFFNPTARRLEAEGRNLSGGGSHAHDVIGHLHFGPVGSAALVNTWPYELAPQPEDLIPSVYMDGSTLIAFFSPVFHEMVPLEQSLFKSAFIHTMQGLPAVSEIQIVVTENYDQAFEMIMRDLSDETGSEAQSQVYDEYYTPYEPLIIYDSNHAGVLLDPLDPPISPTWIDDYTFNHLHFIDATGTGLVLETYFAEDIVRWDEELARYALQLLIYGPRHEGAISLIPPETRVLNLEIVGSDIYVNLSGDFVTRFVGGSRELAELTIYSIVNTLIAELRPPGSPRVFFLIDTQQLEEFHGVEDFHTYFVLNNALLLSYIEAMEDEQEDYDTVEAE
ncbi:MAG: GerMN domain-containing protein [Defluviitaleaceae bacterium]|nr:GerMN domain-containing protein [Defluviitaleaceae bacterium]